VEALVLARYLCKESVAEPDMTHMLARRCGLLDEWSADLSARSQQVIPGPRPGLGRFVGAGQGCAAWFHRSFLAASKNACPAESRLSA